jgi:hypothetical protein
VLCNPALLGPGLTQSEPLGLSCRFLHK